MADTISIPPPAGKSTQNSKNTCVVCGKNTRYKKYCDRHQRQMWLHGKIIYAGRSRNDPNEFVVDGALCHIYRYNKHGEVVAKAIIDKDDVERCRGKKWSLKDNGYVKCDLHGLFLHRFILGLKKGDRCVSDHINGDKLDCRKSNLRKCTQAQNAKNIRGNKKASSKYKGVFRCRGRWRATICQNYQHHRLGDFDGEVDAARAYNEAAVRFHGRFAKTNSLS